MAAGYSRPARPPFFHLQPVVLQRQRIIDINLDTNTHTAFEVCAVNGGSA
jgi:hypothetical protein